MKELMGKTFITTKEAFSRYGYSVQWFQLQRHKKEGPPFVKLNGKGGVLYQLDKTDSWFNENLK
jgi:hypothetical protein